MRILIIADYLPYPLVGGDRIRVYNLLRRVARRHDVSLVAFLETPGDSEGIPHLEQLCANVEVVPLHRLQRRNRLVKLAAMLRFGLAGRPMELSHLCSEELGAKIRALASTVDFDIVQIEHSQMGLYLEALPRVWRGKSILMLHNVTSQQRQRISRVEQRWSRKLRIWASSVAMRTWEPRYAGNFDRCATVSEDDRQLLQRANPRLRVEVIPNGVDIESYQVLPAPQERAAASLVFVGNMGYWPCADAMLYFCSDIYPLICQEIGAVDLWIVGRDPGPEVLALRGSSRACHGAGPRRGALLSTERRLCRTIARGGRDTAQDSRGHGAWPTRRVDHHRRRGPGCD